MSDSLVGGRGLVSVIPKSSGAVHREVSPRPCEDVSVQLKVSMVDNPKSVRQAQPESFTRILVLPKRERMRTYIHRLIGV